MEEKIHTKTHREVKLTMLLLSTVMTLQSTTLHSLRIIYFRIWLDMNPSWANLSSCHPLIPTAMLRLWLVALLFRPQALPPTDLTPARTNPASTMPTITTPQLHLIPAVTVTAMITEDMDMVDTAAMAMVHTEDTDTEDTE